MTQQPSPTPLCSATGRYSLAGPDLIVDLYKLSQAQAQPRHQDLSLSKAGADHTTRHEQNQSHPGTQQEGNRKWNVSHPGPLPVICWLFKRSSEHSLPLTSTLHRTPEGSWHTDYRDTAFIYFGGLPYELTEGDVITIFSQFGDPTFLKLARDKETGKSKGFGWLKYEDQRSTDLAVDNLGGADVGGRIISVDHARYKPRDDEDPAEFDVSWETMMRKEGKLNESEEEEDDESGGEGDSRRRRRILPEEKELADLIRDHDEDDPMKAFLVEEKKKEVQEARKHAEQKEKKKHSHGHGHRSHRRRDASPGESDRRRRHRDSDRDRQRDGDTDRRRGEHKDRESRSHRDEESRNDTRRERRHRDDDDDRERRKGRHGHDSDRDRDRSRNRGRDRSSDGKRRERTRSNESRPKRSRREHDRRRSRSRSQGTSRSRSPRRRRE